jgi:hypothetical protein
MWICISLVAGCLMVLSILLILASSEVMAQNILLKSTLNQDSYLPITLQNYPYQYHHGDWVVTGYEAVENRAIILDGNLLIRPGGSLTLTNVTLMIEQGSKGLYQIYAEEGSNLVISNCTIAPAQTGGRFAFAVQNAHFVLENSRLAGMMNISQNTYLGGLTLTGVTGAVLDGNTIVHPDGIAIRMTDSLSNTITHNTIECTNPSSDSCGAMFLEYSHNNTITHNRLVRQWEAVDMHWSWNNYVAYNEATLTAHTIGFSLWNESGNNVIEYNHISVAPGHEGRT